MQNELDIKSIRDQLGGITQARLAEALGVDQSTVSNWENGNPPRRGPTRTLLLSLKPEDFVAEKEAAE